MSCLESYIATVLPKVQAAAGLQFVLCWFVPMHLQILITNKKFIQEKKMRPCIPLPPLQQLKSQTQGCGDATKWRLRSVGVTGAFDQLIVTSSIHHFQIPSRRMYWLQGGEEAQPRHTDGSPAYFTRLQIKSGKLMWWKPVSKSRLLIEKYALIMTPQYLPANFTFWRNLWPLAINTDTWVYLYHYFHQQILSKIK